MLHYLLEKQGCRSRSRQSMLEVHAGRAELSGAPDEPTGLFTKEEEGGHRRSPQSQGRLDFAWQLSLQPD